MRAFGYYLLDGWVFFRATANQSLRRFGGGKD
jgi:hypothetical protein